MIDVVYLAYQNKEIGYGLDVVKTFIDTYQKNPAGMEHNFHIIAKNWTDKEDYEEICKIAEKNNAKIIDLPDDGFDIGAYFRAAKILTGEYVFFIGSNIEILSNDWLLKIYNGFKSDKKIQLAGPMGSWATGYSGRFPNPHIRTNSFLIKRSLFLEYASTQKFPQTKEDTWALEHCSNSLSNYILKKGYRISVVNADGEVFSLAEWDKSRTYATPDADKPILTDKWARKYYTADETLKLKIEMVNWGKYISLFPENFVKKYSKKINIFIPYSMLMPVHSTEVFHPIFIGEYAQKLNTPALKDNTDINIAQRVERYGELTAYYWIWKNHLKNFEADYIGFTQSYRRLDFNIEGKSKSAFRPIFTDDFEANFKKYTEEDILKCIEGYDIVLPEKSKLDQSVYNQYLLTHKKEDFDIAIDVIKQKYPEYCEATDEVLSSDSLYLFGNFVMKKNLMNEFLDWLFNILEEVEKRTDWNKYGNYTDIVNSKFITERFLNIWLAQKIKTESIKVKSTTSFLIYFEIMEYIQACKAELEALTKGECRSK